MTTPHGSRTATLCLGLSVALVSACGGAGAPPASGPVPEEAKLRTSAVETISAQEIEAQRVTRIEEVLQTRAAGVQVYRQANGDLSVRIRGASSVLGSTEPLFVIDGVPLNQRSASSALRGLNPHDVARVEVLKDAGATAIYGSRGGNGVIVITTKRHQR